MLRKGIPSFTDCLVGDDCCHLILTSISVTAPSDNIHGDEESLSHTLTGLRAQYEDIMESVSRRHQCISFQSYISFYILSN